MSHLGLSFLQSFNSLACCGSLVIPLPKGKKKEEEEEKGEKEEEGEVGEEEEEEKEDGRVSAEG